MSTKTIHINQHNWQKIQTLDFSEHNKYKFVIDRAFAKSERSRIAHIDAGMSGESSSNQSAKKLQINIQGLSESDSFKLTGRNASHDPSIILNQLSATHPLMTRTDNGFRFEIDLSKIKIVGDDTSIPMAFTSNQKENSDEKRRKNLQEAPEPKQAYPVSVSVSTSTEEIDDLENSPVN